MRAAWKLTLTLLAANVLPAQINPNVWKLIRPDEKAVLGFNLDRYRQTAMSAVMSQVTPPIPGTARYVIAVTGPRNSGELTILLGYVPPKPEADPPPMPTMLDATTAVMGADDRVRESMDRWNQDAKLNDLASEARKLSESDDAWFLLSKPLANEQPNPSNTPKHLKEIVDVFEELAGGARFGASYLAHIDVRARTTEDAYSLAALGRWLPGLIQAFEPTGEMSKLLDLAENFNVQAAGRTVTLSFELPEDKLVEFVKRSAPSNPDGGQQ